MSLVSPVVRVVLLAVNILLGAALVVGALLATDAAWQLRVVLALYGGCWLATQPLVVRAWWPRAGADARVRTLAGTTVVLLDPTSLRGGAFVCGWLTAVTALAAVLALASGATAGGVVGLVLAAFFALPLLDLCLALRRGGRLTLTSEQIALRGWRTESSVAWAEVGEIGVAQVQRRPHLVVTARAGATSWQGRHLSHTWPARTRLEPGVLLIDAEGVEPHTAPLYEALRRWARDPSSRTELGTVEAERQLRAAGQSS